MLEYIGRACLVVKLASGGPALIGRRPRASDARDLGFPVALDFAVTISKIQGQTLSAAAIGLDLHWPGIVYSAVSCVRDLKNWLWLRRPSEKAFVRIRV